VNAQQLVIAVQEQDVEVLHMVKGRPEKGAGVVNILGGLDLNTVFGRNPVGIRHFDLGHCIVKNIYEFHCCLADLYRLQSRRLNFRRTTINLLRIMSIEKKI
jgi:hypothetical protein